jgi:hypothetical protein
MKPLLRPTLAALALGLAFLPVAGFAQNVNMNPQNMADRLDQAVGLSSGQRAQVIEIFQKEIEALNAFTPQERPVKGMEARQGALAEVRAMLSPVQRKRYDLTPQGQGGGLTMMSPENEVARLDAAVALTASQKAAAAGIFVEQIEALMDIPPADRPEKGAPIRQAAKAQIRALLTAEQQQKYDATPQSKGGGQKVNPMNLATRLDAVVTLTDEQIGQVAAIFTQESADLQPLTPEEQPTKGREIRQAAKAQVRALLTPEQQQKFDANPNGLEDLEERAFVRNYLMTSANVAARVGTVTRLSLVESSTTLINEARISSGYLSFKVEGSGRTEILKVSWERPTAADPIKIVKLTGADGEAIQP